MSDIQAQAGPNPILEQESLSVFSTAINIPQGEIDSLANWLSNEISRAKSDKSGQDEKMLAWAALYDAEAEEKSFPWPNACGLTVPIVATAVDSLMARFMGAVFGGKDLWIATARSANWVDIVDPVTTWMNWVGKSILKMYRVCQPWFLSMLKFGTGVVKLTWEVVQREVNVADGESMKTEIVTRHNGPVLSPVPLDDFFVSSDAITTMDLQYCSWVAHRFRKTWKQLKELETSGTYQDVDKIAAMKRSAGSELEEAGQAVTGVAVSEYNDFELFEVWCSYTFGARENTPGAVKNPPAELIVTIEPESKTIVRAVYNFYYHQERPFHKIRLMPRENSIFGIGLAEMLNQVQQEVTTIHRQRIDNATLANTKAFKKRQGAQVPDDGIYPGVMIDVDEKDDFETLDLGMTHPTMLQEELHTNSIGEKRSGVSDYTVGRESSAIGSRATATSTMALIREGNKRFLMSIRDIRECLSDIAHQVVMMYQQFAPSNEVIYEIFSEKDKRFIQKFLALPKETTRNGLILDIPALSEAENKEAQQQGIVMLMGAVEKIYMNMFNAFGVVSNPQAPEPVKQLAAQGAKAAAMLMERLLETFDFKDADSFVPDIDSILGQMTQMFGGGNTNGINTQGTGIPQGAGGLPPEPPVAPAGGGAPPDEGIGNEQDVGRILSELNL